MGWWFDIAAMHPASVGTSTVYWEPMPGSTKSDFSKGCSTLIVTLGVLVIMVMVQRDAATRKALQSVWVDFIAWLMPGLKGVFAGNFVVELIRSALVAVVILALGAACRNLPKSLDLLRAKRFWGKGVTGDGIALCFGSLVDSRSLDQNPNPLRYLKKFRDSRVLRISGPTENIIGMGEVRAASYLINMLSRYRRVPVAIEDDQTALKRLNRSIVSFGSAASNEITEIIEQDSANRFLAIETGELPRIRCKVTNALFKFEITDIRRDYGIILKTVNQRFPGQYLFTCAGLGEWGTSGSAWYLATHWKDLSALGNEFGCVVEVEIGSDQSARVVYDSANPSRKLWELQQQQPQSKDASE